MVAATCKAKSCNYCYNSWRTQVRAKILRGMEQEGVHGYKFLTITTRVDKLESGWAQLRKNRKILENWRRLRKHFWRKYENPRYFKVVEFTAKGYIHFHFVIDADIPLLPEVKDKESWVKYRNRIGLEQREFIREIQAFGFGWNTNVQDVRHNRGAAKYLSKYMSKDHEKYDGWQPPEHMQDLVHGLRMAEGSRNWYSSPRGESTYSFANARYTDDEPNMLKCSCVTSYRTLHNKRRLREKNCEVWMNVANNSENGLHSVPIWDASVRYVQAREELLRQTRDKNQIWDKDWKKGLQILQKASWQKIQIKQAKNYLRENTTLPLGWLWKHRKELELCHQ